MDGAKFHVDQMIHLRFNATPSQIEEGIGKVKAVKKLNGHFLYDVKLLDGREYIFVAESNLRLPA